MRQERETKAAAERLAAEAEATLADGEPDWSDQAFLDGLRASVLAQRAASNEAHIAGMRRLRESQFGIATADTMLADEAARSSQVDDWLSGSDPILEHPAYLDHQRQQFEATRAREAARMGRIGYVDEIAEAEAYIAATKAKALAGGQA
jgi:hypothetical protein